MPGDAPDAWIVLARARIIVELKDASALDGRFLVRVLHVVR